MRLVSYRLFFRYNKIMADTYTLRFIFILPLMLLFLSCASSPESSNLLEPGAEESGNSYSTWQDLRTPVIGRLDLPPANEVVPLPTPEPSWLPDDLPWWVWLPYSSNESSLFLGTSYPRVSRTEELKYCIRNAAEQAAQYAGIAAQVSSFRGTFQDGTGYAEDIRLQYNEQQIPRLLKEAEIQTLHQDETGSYSLIRFPSLSSDSSSAIDLEFKLLEGVSEPEWISHVPELEGYYLGLGVSRPRIRFADSIAQADKAALAEILYQLPQNLKSAIMYNQEMVQILLFRKIFISIQVPW